jgi:ATP-dependent RNA helicase DDX51/DBP6
MDVASVANVINYDPPVYPKTYVHRAGRTARAGQAGAVYTLLKPEDVVHFNGMASKLQGGKVQQMRLQQEQLQPLRPALQEALQQVQQLLQQEKQEQEQRQRAEQKQQGQQKRQALLLQQQQQQQQQNKRQLQVHAAQEADAGPHAAAADRAAGIVEATGVDAAAGAGITAQVASKTGKPKKVKRVHDARP